MKTIDRKDWEKKQRKNRIVDIAQEIFFKKGFENATMEDIASAAGYNQRTVYLYFKDKQDLFLAVVLRGLKILNSMLKDAFDSPEKKYPKIIELGRAYFNFFIRHPEYFDLIMAYESKTCIYYKKTQDEKDEYFKTECQRATDESADIVTTAIKDAIKNNIIKTSLSPRQVMLILWGQIFGVTQIVLMRKEFFEDAYGIAYEDLFSHFIDLAEKALMIEF